MGIPCPDPTPAVVVVSVIFALHILDQKQIVYYDYYTPVTVDPLNFSLNQALLPFSQKGILILLHVEQESEPDSRL